MSYLIIMTELSRIKNLIFMLYVIEIKNEN